MPPTTFLDPSLQYGRSSATWREGLPTIVGLTIIIGFVTFNLVSALLEPTDWTVSPGVRTHRLTGGSYWVDPQSLGRMMRAVIISTGNNWILAIIVAPPLVLLCQSL
jgi:hypothetical protein